MAQKAPSGVFDNAVFEWQNNLENSTSAEVGIMVPSLVTSQGIAVGMDFADFDGNDVAPSIHVMRVPFDGRIVNANCTFFWNSIDNQTFGMPSGAALKLIEFKTFEDALLSKNEGSDLPLARTMAQVVIPPGFQVPGGALAGGIPDSFQTLPVEIIVPTLKGGTYIAWRGSPWSQTNSTDENMNLRIGFGLE